MRWRSAVMEPQDNRQENGGFLRDQGVGGTLLTMLWSVFIGSFLVVLFFHFQAFRKILLLYLGPYYSKSIRVIQQLHVCIISETIQLYYLHALNLKPTFVQAVSMHSLSQV